MAFEFISGLILGVALGAIAGWEVGYIRGRRRAGDYVTGAKRKIE